MAVSSILCALICSSVEAGPTDSITIGDYTWTYGYYNYGTYRDARIMGVSPAKGDITIPDSFSQGGKDVIVTEIVRILNYDELQIENNELTSVTIPASVNIIRVGAFTNCTGLTTMMVLCDYFSGKEISGCRNLTNLTIGKWLNEFERNYSDSSRGGLSRVFPDSYRNIRQVAILDSVTKIGSKAFYNFSAMTKVDIPNSVTSIGDFAFCGCRSLSSIIIPNSVTDIGLYAFNEAGLECVTLQG